MIAEAPAALPEQVRAWTNALAPQAVVDVTAIGGGITNTKWLVCLADGDSLVLRWSDPAVWGGTGREHVRREALACRLLASSALPVPRLVASDVDGATAGSPRQPDDLAPRVAYVLTGWSPAAITALARLAVGRCTSSPRRREHQPPTFSFRGPAEPEVPGWARWPGLWKQAIDVWAAGPHVNRLLPQTRPPSPARNLRLGRPTEREGRRLVLRRRGLLVHRHGQTGQGRYRGRLQPVKTYATRAPGHQVAWTAGRRAVNVAGHEPRYRKRRAGEQSTRQSLPPDVLPAGPAPDRRI